MQHGTRADPCLVEACARFAVVARSPGGRTPGNLRTAVRESQRGASGVIVHAGSTHSENDRLPLRKSVARESLDVVVVQIREVPRERTRETISIPAGAVHYRKDIGVSPEASSVGVLRYLLRMLSSV